MEFTSAFTSEKIAFLDTTTFGKHGVMTTNLQGFVTSKTAVKHS